jgi:putative tryptophan/tyrosine transport system substrate-binding protein
MKHRIQFLRRRREFISLLGGAAAWPLVARAQQAAIQVIGFLHVGTAGDIPRALAGFRQGLKETGFVEGQNLAIEFRWANHQPERLPELAADLVARQVAVIAAGGGAATALAAKAATTTTPVVLAFGSDPVRLGLVSSLNRPGGNVTGVTFLTTELVGKRLELLCELVPLATTVAYLTPGERQSTVVTEQMTSEFLAAARALHRQPLVLQVDSEDDFEAAFARLVNQGARALVIASSPLFDSEKLPVLALRHAVPAIYQRREFAEAGGLMSYGASFADAFRLAAIYVGQILKGAKPADLPFQQSTKLDLVINLKTAKTLGLAVPTIMQMTADDVIE